MKKKRKMYILVEFPYPSGSGLHMGHAFTFTGGDVYARYWRMKGREVLFPMGWDAFGLPTENYAIRTGKKPQEVTERNSKRFKEQMKKLWFSFDWEREINTTDPAYYRWTQWIFIQLFKKGLAYKKKMPINWCLSCKIGLANEEVVDGKCERCGGQVERREIDQWIVKITDYADRLIGGLKKTDFVEKVKKAQINWIGKSEGVEIDYPVIGEEGKVISCYSTRPDTNFGATFVVMAPEHKLVDELTKEEYREAVEAYKKEAKKKSELERTELEKEKTGVFTGSYCLNRLNGRKMPIYVADFVVLSAGTGIVVGVPAHDKRDWVFAKKYDIEMIPVIRPLGGKSWDYEKEPYVDIDEAEVFNSDFLDGMKALEAKNKIIDYLVDKGWGRRAKNYHLRDWIFSRQHYWGEPIPMIFCQSCSEKIKSQIMNSPPTASQSGGQANYKVKQIYSYIKEMGIDKRAVRENPGWWPVRDEDLPVKLPQVEAYQPSSTGDSPLANIDEFVKTKCPVCGGEARRETDTMPNWAGSDWYFLGYLVSKSLKLQTTNRKSETKKVRFQDIFSANMSELERWLPVDVYIGGDEHNTLHLLYSRFIYQFLWDLGVVPKSCPEPYYKRVSHGVILGPDGQRMSKSRGNVIVPDEIVEKYGVDVVRCYLMFMGPFTGTMVWDERTLLGVKRFLGKFGKFVEKQIANKSQASISNKQTEIRRIIDKTAAGVGKDVEEFGFNTAIAKMMEMINQLRSGDKKAAVGRGELKKMVKMLAPFAPCLANKWWRKMGEKEVLETAAWPEADRQGLKEERVTIPVAVNGKVRGQMECRGRQAPGAESEILRRARDLPEVQKWIKEKKIIREIWVPGRMVNLVVKDD